MSGGERASITLPGYSSVAAKLDVGIGRSASPTVVLSDADAPRTGTGNTRLLADRLAFHLAQAASLVADAYQEHRLACVLENIDDALVRVLKVNGLSVGDQMKLGVGVH